MTDEPTDDECKAIAMLLGPSCHYLKTVRIRGKKVIRDQLQRRYYDPVTLEVVWLMDAPGNKRSDFTLID